jgi:hypothetical protein
MNADDVRVSMTNTFDIGGIEVQLDPEQERPFRVGDRVRLKGVLSVPNEEEQAQAVTLFHDVRVIVRFDNSRQEVRLYPSGDHFAGEFIPIETGSYLLSISAEGRELTRENHTPIQVRVEEAIIGGGGGNTGPRQTVEVQELEQARGGMPVWVGVILGLISLAAVGVLGYLAFNAVKNMMGNFGTKYMGKVTINYVDSGRIIFSRPLPLYLMRGVHNVFDLINENEPKGQVSERMQALIAHPDLKKISLKPGTKFEILLKNMSSLCIEIEAHHSYGVISGNKIRTGIKSATPVSWLAEKDVVISTKVDMNILLNQKNDIQDFSTATVDEGACEIRLYYER